MHTIIILGVTAFLASIWGIWQAIKSVSKGSNFDEQWNDTEVFQKSLKDNLEK